MFKLQRRSILVLSMIATGSAVFGLAVFRPAEARGEVIVGYESLNPVGGVTAAVSAAGVVALDLSRGPGIERASGSTFNTRGWNTDPIPEADSYIEWGWSDSSRSIDFESLDVRYDRSSSGPKQVEIHLAVNDFAFEPIFCDSDVSSTGEEQLAIELADFGDVESATFRMYAFDADSASGTFDLESLSGTENLAIMVTGHVSAVPEPTTMTMLWSVAACFFGVKTISARRRSRATKMPRAV